MNVFIDIQSQADHDSPQKVVKNHQKQEQSKESAKQRKRYERTLKDIVSDSAYHWTLVEQKKYIDFLIKKREVFNLPLEQKKKLRMYTLMQNYVFTKCSKQCRSHHQKMMKKHSTIEGIIEEYSHLANPTDVAKMMSETTKIKEKEQEKEKNEEEKRVNLEKNEINQREWTEKFNMNIFDFEISLEQPHEMREE